MLRRFVIQSVNRLRMLHFNRQIHTCYHNIFLLLNKICDGESSKEPFLKAATLSILIWAYPREIRTSNGNLKMPPFCRVRLLTRDKHAHSFCHCVDFGDFGYTLRDLRSQAKGFGAENDKN